MESLGEYIKRRREEMDYSLREFARKIEITATFLSDIEKGTRHPSDEVLKKISDKFGDNFEDLKDLDNRVPVKELKELFNSNPKYGFAFRKLAENKISPDELLRLIEENKNE
jgi:transcriptional regulator with XRE-family HTH domain